MGAWYSLTLNQDKRRRFDSYPGSILAGQSVVRLLDASESDPDCAHSGAQPRSLEELGRGVDRFEWVACPGPVESPLPEPCVGEPVWRPGWGWVEPVVLPDVAPERETAVAA